MTDAILLPPPVPCMAIVPTRLGSQYLQQLCRHWSHKFQVRFNASQGRIAMPLGTVELAAGDMAMAVTCAPLRGADAGDLQAVVARHLNRFAFREGALTFAWQAG